MAAVLPMSSAPVSRALRVMSSLLSWHFGPARGMANAFVRVVVGMHGRRVRSAHDRASRAERHVPYAAARAILSCHGKGHAHLPKSRRRVCRFHRWLPTRWLLTFHALILAGLSGQVVAQLWRIVTTCDGSFQNHAAAAGWPVLVRPEMLRRRR